MFWQHLVIQLNLARSISHIYVFFPYGDLPKNWSETLANQNKNSVILDAQMEKIKRF